MKIFLQFNNLCNFVYYIFLPGMRIQEWWEDLSLIRSARLPSQGQNTWFVYFKILIELFRIICDNGDNMEKVAKNVFLNEDPEHFVNCWKVPTVSLKPWAGTDKLLFVWFVKSFVKDCEGETEILLSRPRRDIRTENERIVRVEDLGKSSFNASKNF